MTVEDTDRLPSTAAFRVGEWLLEPSLDRLSRNGTVVHLRPQLTNLLVLLARNAGRTVPKNEILAKVWDGQFVAESGMTRCVAEIRQALGDDARDPKILQTITKRGYRLVAPVVMVRVAPRVSVLDAALPVAPPAPAPHEEPKQYADQSIGLRAEQPADAQAHAPRWLRQAAGLTLGAAAFASLVLALVPLAGRWIRVPAAPVQLGERDTVLLADVVNTTGDATFDQTLHLALGVHLGQAPFLRILPSPRVRAGLVMMGRPHSQAVTGSVALELCRREGAAVLLAPSISRVGSHYVVGLEALACSGGESVARELIEVAAKEDVLEALGAAAGRLRRTLGESRESLSRYDVPIVQATTPSLDALKALSLGDFARDHSRLPEALMHYRRATELDPWFAAAWARRGAAAHSVGQMFGDDRSGETDEIQIAFRTAYDLRDRVSEAERLYILGHYYRLVRGDPEKAIETYRLWNRTYPGSSAAATNVASVYVNTLGRYEAGLADAREAVRLAPSSTIANGTLIAAYLGTGRLAEAKQALSEAGRQGAGDLGWHRLAFQIAYAEGDTRTLADQVKWASADPSAAMVMAEYLALAAASQGRLRDARERWAEAAEHARKVATAAVRAGILLRQAETEALLGDRRRARAAAEEALALDGQAMTRLAAAESLALAGEPSRAARLLDDVTRRAQPATGTTFVWQPTVRALIETGSGRRSQALQALAETARYERGRHYGFVPLGVRASVSLRAGRPKEAAEAFSDLLSLRQVLPLSPWVSFARLGLARALRDARSIEGSRAAYDVLIESMKDADEDAPLLVAARRERAALR